VPQMVAEVGRRKALANVLERAVVTDASGNVVDLSAIFPTAEETEETEEEDDEPDDEQPATTSPAGSAASDPTALPSF
jgi:trigger factor